MQVLRRVSEIIERHSLAGKYDVQVKAAEKGARGLVVTHFFAVETPGKALKELNALAESASQSEFKRSTHPESGQEVYLLSHFVEGALNKHEQKIISDARQFNGLTRLRNLILYLERRQKTENQ
ncbi:MAG: hypothetical protein ACP5O3_00110 [Candidatus Micrarchaeia archaeon]